MPTGSLMIFKDKSRAHNMYTDRREHWASVKTRPRRVYWFLWPTLLVQQPVRCCDC